MITIINQFQAPYHQLPDKMDFFSPLSTLHGKLVKHSQNCNKAVKNELRATAGIFTPDK